jgi:hypothetical protein
MYWNNFKDVFTSKRKKTRQDKGKGGKKYRTEWKRKKKKENEE